MGTLTCFADHEGRDTPLIIDTNGRDPAHIRADHWAREHANGTRGGFTVEQYEAWRNKQP